MVQVRPVPAMRMDSLIFWRMATSGGLMVRKDQPEQIARELKRLKDSENLRVRLGSSARKRIEEKLSLAAVGAALDRFLTV
jgi:glycosyltransferase involved in cell wall biosynthesis